VIYAEIEMSQKEGQKELNVICIEVVVEGTRENEGVKRSGVHHKEEWTKDRALGDTTKGYAPRRQVSYTFDTEGTK